MNFQLHNDKVWTFAIKPQNAAGLVPWPNGSNPSVVSSNPASLGAAVAMGNGQIGQPATYFMVLTPKVQISPGLSVTISNVGMQPVTFAVDVVADPDMLSVTVDPVPFTTPQSVPTVPGP